MDTVSRILCYFKIKNVIKLWQISFQTAQFGACRLPHHPAVRHTHTTGSVPSVSLCAVGAPQFCGAVNYRGRANPQYQGSVQKLLLVDSQTELPPKRAYLNFCYGSEHFFKWLLYATYVHQKQGKDDFITGLRAGICAQFLYCFLVCLNQGWWDRPAWR